MSLQGHFYTRKEKPKNHYFKQNIEGNYYFKATVKVKLAKIITLDRTSKKIATLNPLLRQSKQTSLL